MKAGEICIRATCPADRAHLRALYSQAFPREDLAGLLDALLDEPAAVVSLAAWCNGELAGHAAFTLCPVEGASRLAVLVGPLAVAPAAQRRGVGRALIKRGISVQSRAGAAIALVLGDPAYYSRLGFHAEKRITTPYAIPPAWAQAWQSLALCSDTSGLEGRLQVPAPWRDRALWAP